PAGGADGVLATQGGRFGGWALLVMEGRPMFAYAFSNQDGAMHPNQSTSKWRFASKDKLTPGAPTIAFEFNYDGGVAGQAGNGRPARGRQKSGGRPHGQNAAVSFLPR